MATSTVINGKGSVLRGPVAGPLTALDDGSLTFNTGGVAVNDVGVVAIQVEHRDPVAYVRALLLFSAPAQTLAQTYAAVDQLGVSEQPTASINASGDVAADGGGGEGHVARGVDRGGRAAPLTPSSIDGCVFLGQRLGGRREEQERAYIGDPGLPALPVKPRPRHR